MLPAVKVVPRPPSLAPRVANTVPADLPAPSRVGLPRPVGPSAPSAASSSTPEPVQVEAETDVSTMTKTMEYWRGTKDQVDMLLSLIYVGTNNKIIDVRRPDIITEILGMLIAMGWDDTWTFLNDVDMVTPDVLMWSQESMNEGRKAVVRELLINRTEEVGVKGVGKCRHCASTEIAYAALQTRSSDEPMTIFARCTMCQRRWKE